MDKQDLCKEIIGWVKYCVLRQCSKLIRNLIDQYFVIGSPIDRSITFPPNLSHLYMEDFHPASNTSLPSSIKEISLHPVEYSSTAYYEVLTTLTQLEVCNISKTKSPDQILKRLVPPSVKHIILPAMPTVVNLCLINPISDDERCLMSSIPPTVQVLLLHDGYSNWSMELEHFQYLPRHLKHLILRDNAPVELVV